MHVKKTGSGKTYFSTLKLLWITFKATWALTTAALTIPTDLIYICKPHPMNSLAGLAGKLFLKKVVFLDYDDYEAAIGHFPNKWQKAIVRYFEDHTPKLVNHISTHTEFLRDRLLGLGIPPEKISYLPSGIDEDRFKSIDAAKVNLLRKEYNLEGKQVIGFVGSLSLPSHPIELLIKAFTILQTQITDIVLLLVGGGEQLESLKKQVQVTGQSENIRFTGRVRSGEIPEYYQLMDVVVDPVYDDPQARGRLPLKMLESWVSGVPFVSGDVGDRRRLLGDPPAGLLAIPGDPDDFCKKILQVLQEPRLSQDLQQRGLSQAGRYSWNNVTSEVLAALERYQNKQ